MTVLRGIAPFIVYAIVSSFTSWRTAAIVAAALSLWFMLRALKAGEKLDELIIEIVGVVWFGACAVIGYALPHAGIQPYVGAGGQLALAVAVLVTLLIGKPFTEPLARREAPEVVWAMPAFKKFNNQITAGWAIGLGVSGVVLVIMAIAGITNVWSHVPVVLAGVLLPVWYQRRRAEAFKREMTPA